MSPFSERKTGTFLFGSHIRRAPRGEGSQPRLFYPVLRRFLSRMDKSTREMPKMFQRPSVSE